VAHGCWGKARSPRVGGADASTRGSPALAAADRRRSEQEGSAQSVPRELNPEPFPLSPCCIFSQDTLTQARPRLSQSSSGLCCQSRVPLPPRQRARKFSRKAKGRKNGRARRLLLKAAAAAGGGRGVRVHAAGRGRQGETPWTAAQGAHNRSRSSLRHTHKKSKRPPSFLLLPSVSGEETPRFSRAARAPARSLPAGWHRLERARLSGSRRREKERKKESRRLLRREA